jgi:hypothetical protein
MFKAGDLGSFFFTNSNSVDGNKIIKITSNPVQKFTTFQTSPSV